MKILLGTHTFFPQGTAGTEVLTLELAKGLQRRGHAVHILTGAPDRERPAGLAPYLEEAEHDGLPVTRLRFGTGRNRRAIADHADAPERVRLVEEVVLRERPHVVHLNHIMGLSGEVIPRVRRMGIPVVFTPTDFWTVCPTITLFKQREEALCMGPEPSACLRCLRPMGPGLAKVATAAPHEALSRVAWPFRTLAALARRTEDLAVRVNAADRILPATRFLAEVLVRHGVDASRVRLVPYGVDVGELTPKAPVPQAFTEAAPLRIGFIGTFAATKGAHVLLESLAHLREPHKVTVDVYGALHDPDPYQVRLLALARASPARVSFRGTFPHDRIGKVLRGMHLLVVPSLWHENAPLVLVSALNAGTPVLVSDVRGLSDLVEEGVAGFVFPRGDARALARRISDLVDDPSPLLRIPGQAASPRTTEDYVEDVEAIHREVCREVPAQCP